MANDIQFPYGAWRVIAKGKQTVKILCMHIWDCCDGVK